MSSQNNKRIDPEIVEITAEQDTESSSRNKIATLEVLFFELDKRDERLRKASIHKMRKIGLAALFLLVLGWLLVICTFLFFSGYSNPTITIRLPFIFYGWFPKTFHFDTVPILQLSDPVIIALIGSTTVNVVGLFYVAARWLYSTPQPGLNR